MSPPTKATMDWECKRIPATRLPSVSPTQWLPWSQCTPKRWGQSICRIIVRLFFQISVTLPSIPEQFLLHIVHLASVAGALGCLHSLSLASCWSNKTLQQPSPVLLHTSGGIRLISSTHHRPAPSHGVYIYHLHYRRCIHWASVCQCSNIIWHQQCVGIVGYHHLLEPRN